MGLLVLTVKPLLLLPKQRMPVRNTCDQSSLLAYCTPGTQVGGTNVCTNAGGTTWCCRDTAPNPARIFTSPASCVCNDNTACTNCAALNPSPNALCDITTQKCKSVFNLEYCCASGSMVISTLGGIPSCRCSELNSQCTNCFPAGQTSSTGATILPTPVNSACNTLTEKCTSLDGQQYCCPIASDIVLKSFAGVDTCGCYSATGVETPCTRCTTAPTPTPQPGPAPTPQNAEILLRSFTGSDCSGVPDEIAFLVNDPEACQSYYSTLRKANSHNFIT